MRIAICDDDFAEVKMISQHIRSHKHPHEVTLFASPRVFGYSNARWKWLGNCEET